MDNVTYHAPDKEYTKIHNDMVFDIRLSDKDIRLFIMMASMPNGITFTTEGFPLLHKVRELPGFSRASVKRSLVNLKQCGYVIFTPTKQTNGRIFGGTYSLFGMPTSQGLNNEPMVQTAQNPMAQNCDNGSKTAKKRTKSQNVTEKAFSTTGSNHHWLKSEPQDKDLDIDKDLEEKKKDIFHISKEKVSQSEPERRQYVASSDIIWGADPDLPF